MQYQHQDSEIQKDVFISYAKGDKLNYIDMIVESLNRGKISHWLDDEEISWGDSVGAEIDRGLRESRFVLLCLSRNFLERNWPEAEMYSAMAVQNRTGIKRMLPLILDSRDEVLKAYPLLADKAYREYTDPESVAGELARLLEKDSASSGYITITVESVHSDQVCKFRVSPRSSVQSITSMAVKALKLKTQAEVGSHAVINVRWVLIDVGAEAEWYRMSRNDKHEVWAVTSAEGGIRLSRSPTDRIGDLGVKSNTVFHISAIEDVQYMQMRPQTQQQQQQTDQ